MNPLPALKGGEFWLAIKLEGTEFDKKRASMLPLFKKLFQDPDEIWSGEPFSKSYKEKSIIYLREFTIPETHTKMLLAAKLEGNKLTPITSFSPRSKQLEVVRSGKLIYTKKTGLSFQPSSEMPARVTEDFMTRNLPQQEIDYKGLSKPTITIPQEKGIVKGKIEPTAKEALAKVEKKIADVKKYKSQLQIQRYWVLCILALSMVYWIKQNGCLTKIIPKKLQTFNQYTDAIKSMIELDSFICMSKNRALLDAHCPIKSNRLLTHLNKAA